MNRFETFFCHVCSSICSNIDRDDIDNTCHVGQLNNFIVHKALDIAGKMELLAEQREQWALNSLSPNSTPTQVVAKPTQRKKRSGVDKKKKLTQRIVRLWLNYDEQTGVFTRLKGRGIGQVAGYTRQDGSVDVKIKNISIVAHKLAWFYMTGEWSTMVKHKNNNKSDNSWSNLYLADDRNIKQSWEHQQKIDLQLLKPWSIKNQAQRFKEANNG